jgi:maltooligosyltrehalose trehalohydrolase
MLFMGEEHGEPAPFQFFTDHIDEEIATATREGRRREFAAFAEFAGDEVPDPQDPATFERSKLSRRGDPALRALYRRLLEARRALPAGGDAEAIDADPAGPWLRVRRGAFTLAANFAAEPATVPVDGATEVVLATHEAGLDDRGVRLPARGGALVR